MINITIGTNLSRKTVIANEGASLRSVLTDNGVNANATIHIDGMPVDREELDYSLAELDVEEGSYLIAVVKADNAK